MPCQKLALQVTLQSIIEALLLSRNNINNSESVSVLPQIRTTDSGCFRDPGLQTLKLKVLRKNENKP